GPRGVRRCAEPFGERGLISMCHHIEDPTFDATVQAINPRARCRPVHRPPRAPGHTGPVCRWEGVIEEDAAPAAEAPITKLVRMSTAASFEFGPVRDRSGDGKEEGCPTTPARRGARGSRR